MSPPRSVTRAMTGRGSLLFIVFVAALLGGAAYLFGLSWNRLFPPAVFSASAVAECDLRVIACTARFENGHAIRLDLGPKGLPAGEPLQATIAISGFEADGVSIEFSGVDMNMGLIRSELAAESKGEFAGSTLLPVCIRQRMTWRATVAARGPEGIHKATFEFEIRRT